MIEFSLSHADVMNLLQKSLKCVHNF